MSRAEWELIETRRAQAMADRLESEALTAALEAGQDTLVGQLAYALAWRSHQDATRIVRLENARGVPTSAQGAAAPSPPTPPGGGAPPLSLVPEMPNPVKRTALTFESIMGRKPRASRK